MSPFSYNASVHDLNKRDQFVIKIVRPPPISHTIDLFITKYVFHMCSSTNYPNLFI